MGDRELKTWVGDQLQTLLGFSEKVAVEYMIALGTCGSGGGGERRGAEGSGEGEQGRREGRREGGREGRQREG